MYLQNILLSIIFLYPPKQVNLLYTVQAALIYIYYAIDSKTFEQEKFHD